MRGKLEVPVSFFRFRSDFLAFFARISHFKFKEFNKTIIPLYAGSALALYYWQVFGFSFSHPQSILLLHLSCYNGSGSNRSYLVEKSGHTLY